MDKIDDLATNLVEGKIDSECPICETLAKGVRDGEFPMSRFKFFLRKIL
jgi:hypothetical protein